MSSDLQAKLTSKGQITIPIEVRKALGLHRGDSLHFEIADDHIVMRPQRQASSFADYAGALREPSLSARDIIERLREERGW